MTKSRFPIQVNLTIKPLEERHFVTLAIILMIAGMLLMAREDPELWKVELFKTLLTAFVITGFLNMVVSFHFSANKSDEKKSENTAKAFDAIAATAAVAAQPADAQDAAVKAADQVAAAASDKADEIAAPAEGEVR